MASKCLIFIILFVLTLPVHTGWIKEYGKNQAHEVFKDVPKRVSIEPNKDLAQEYRISTYGQFAKSKITGHTLKK